MLGPGYEYAIRDGEVVVNRIFPFLLEQELVTVSRTEVACLTITQPGLLNTLAWPSGLGCNRPGPGRTVGRCRCVDLR